ncbi:MAG: peptidoglycan recognition protein [Nocardioides sp.]|nr:peptidoglycan recognition protein [Nocardioides sp.]
MPLEPVDRRPFLKAFAGGAAALAVVGGASRVFLNPDGSPVGPTGLPGLQLSAESGSDVDSLHVILGDELLPAAGRGRWRSARLPTSTHSMVALTWTEPAPTPLVHVRSRVSGEWGPWMRLPALHDVADPDSGEATDVSGTDLVWIGRADGIQVQVRGKRPDDLRLLLLHPRPHARDRTAGKAAPTLLRRRAGAVLSTPEILNRTAWGADESWRGKPTYIETIDQVHVHHTVTRNDYTPEDVPALIRGMYRYHTKTLGWSDIGYNFLVDRFGRTWTGRAGGASRSVRGAHTLGFNARSTGVSAIGNYDQVTPSGATLDAIAAVAAWKLDLFGRDPLGTTTVVSEGSDRFRGGKSVSLPVIDGHRDTNQTSCPGSLLYAALPDIRQRARTRLDQATAAAQAPVAVVRATAVAGAAVMGQSLTVTPGAYTPGDAVASYAWTCDGVAVPGATGSSYQVGAADVGRVLALVVTAARAGLASGTETVAAGGPVTAPPVITIEPVGRRRKAVVRVRVAAPDGTGLPVTGQVVVGSRSRNKTLTLVDGQARTRFTRLRPGRHPVKVDYSGGGLLLPARARASVRVS